MSHVADREPQEWLGQCQRCARYSVCCVLPSCLRVYNERGVSRPCGGRVQPLSLLVSQAALVAAYKLGGDAAVLELELQWLAR